MSKRTMQLAVVSCLLLAACSKNRSPQADSADSSAAQAQPRYHEGAQAKSAEQASGRSARFTPPIRVQLPGPTAEQVDQVSGSEEAASADEPSRTPDVVYVPTPQPVVDRMLELAEVQQDDVVYDLGCGDGRIVVTAAKRYGTRAYGFDIDPRRVQDATNNVRRNGVEHLVTIEQKDIFTLDLAPADVVTLYLLPELNVKLIPQLERLRPGSRVVSHDFDMRGVRPERHVWVRVDDSARQHEVYLFRIPLTKLDDSKGTLL